MKLINKVVLPIALSSFFIPSAMAENDPQQNWQSLTSELINGFLAKEAKYIQVNYASLDGDESDGGESGWELKYDWVKDVPLASQVDKTSYSSFSQRGMNAYINGSHMLSGKDNVHDFSKAGLSYQYSSVIFPELAPDEVLTVAQSSAVQQCVLDIPTPIGDDVAFCKSRLGFRDESVGIHGFTVSVKADIEGKQDFSEKQYAYGLELGYKYKPSEGHWLKWANPVDWPLRITRKLSGISPDYKNPLPTFIIGVERVDPENNDDRNTITGNSDDYDRVHGEISYAAPMGIFKGQPVKFNFSYRYFKELNPSSQIEAGNLDSFNYRAYAIQIPAAAFNLGKGDQQQIVISYSSGKLPFDRNSEKVFEIGWKSNVDLMDLMASALGG